MKKLILSFSLIIISSMSVMAKADETAQMRYLQKMAGHWEGTGKDISDCGSGTETEKVVGEFEVTVPDPGAVRIKYNLDYFSSNGSVSHNPQEWFYRLAGGS